MGESQHSFLSKKNGCSLSTKALVNLIKAVHEKGLPFRFCASGQSMSPFVKNGDILTVAPRKESGVHCGDVVAFIHNQTGKPVVHRVIHRKGNFLLIRGDNTPNEDGLIPLSDILGIVIRVERKGKKVYLGLGPEKYLIAFLSGKSLLNLLRSILSQFRKGFRPISWKVLL